MMMKFVRLLVQRPIYTPKCLETIQLMDGLSWLMSNENEPADLRITENVFIDAPPSDPIVIQYLYFVSIKHFQWQLILVLCMVGRQQHKNTRQPYYVQACSNLTHSKRTHGLAKFVENVDHAWWRKSRVASINIITQRTSAF